MKIACGTDIIETERIKQSIESTKDKFLNRVYTQKEIQYCEEKGEQKYQHYAARFAAKEAILKALTSKIQDKYSIAWKEIEITNQPQGRPKISLSDSILKQVNIQDMDLSLSHSKQYAIATVVMQIKNRKDERIEE